MNAIVRSLGLLIAVAILLAAVILVGPAARSQGGSGEKDSKGNSNKSTTRPRPRPGSRRSSNRNINRRVTPTPVTYAASLAGTSWAGPDSTGDYRRFTFTSNGRLNNDASDTWRQEGNKIYWEINDGYSHYEGTINGDQIDYKAYNKVNLRWTGTLTRVAGSTTSNPNADANFSGVSIRIVHIPQRLADAQVAAARLRSLGADVTLYETSDSGNGDWVGRIVYWEGQEELANRIASKVSDIEVVTPKFSADTEGKRTFYLWIANKKQGSSVANNETNFRGVSIRVVHIPQRLADAQVAAARLRSLGAEVTLYETSDSGNGDWVGRIVYWEGQEELASRIASRVADIEVVTPKFSSDTEGKRTFYLWIASKK
jgi:hypothetical protein